MRQSVAVCWRIYPCLFVLWSVSVRSLYLQGSQWSAKKAHTRDLCSYADDEFLVSTGNSTQDVELYFTGLLVDDGTTTQVYNRAACSEHIHHSRRLEEHALNKAVVNELANIYRQDIVMSERMLESGLSNMGDLVNIRRFMRRLVTGQPIKIVALGGSVTAGQGVRNPRSAYVNQISEWINNTWPHSEHELINHAIPAINSGYVAPCVTELVPNDTDLVLLEFTFNDSERGSMALNDTTLRGLERLLRKLMRMPAQPGLIYLHYWAGRHLKDNFTHTAEDAINTMLKFYGLLGLSMRDSVRELQLREDAAGLTAKMFLPLTTTDDVHPSCIGTRYLADLVIGHLQDLAASELVSHHTATATAMVTTTAKEGSHRARLHQGRTSIDALGPPLQPDNWANLTESCILDPEEFKQLARPGPGFEWVDEGRHPGKHKWGYVSRQPGASIEVDVPLPPGRPDNSSAYTIGLGFLLSYEHMGMAFVKCVEGCQCETREYSFHHPYKMSITGWRVVEVTQEGDAKNCTLAVTVDDRSYSQPAEAKVKISSLMISEEKDFLMPWLFCGVCGMED